MARYALTFCALGVLFVLMSVQHFVEGAARNAAGMRPGDVAPSAGRPFVWRAERTRINTVEHGPLFAVMAIAGVLLGVSPALAAGLAAAFALTRVAFTVFYYAEVKTARSAVFFLGSLVTAAQALLVLVSAARLV